MPEREVVQVFLASPGGVDEERRVAREVVDQVNSTVGRQAGVLFDVYGWEDESPAYGRPQDIINERLPEADLFIGFIWRQWGSPPGSAYTSGFEEEFRTAVKLREEKGRPEIALYFRDVDQYLKRYPNDELRKIEALRKDIEEKFTTFYKGYSDVNDWRYKLTLLLTEYAAKRQAARSAKQTSEPQQAPVPGPSSGSDETAGTGPAASGAAVQLIAALESGRDATAASDGANLPDRFEAARVLLASFTWVSELQTAEVLDTHETNLLYTLRDQLEPLARERVQLIRSMLLSEPVRPGWYWFSAVTRPEVLLALLATADRNAEVRRRALEVLGDVSLLKDPPEGLPGLEPETFLRQVLDDSDANVRIVGLELAGKHATPETVDLLRSLQAGPESSGWAPIALARALLRDAPDEAAEIIRTNRYIVITLGDELVEVADRLSDETIELLRGSELSLLREVALRVEIASGRLTEENARRALGDADENVRSLAANAIADSAWTLTEDKFEAAVKAGLSPDATHRLRLHQALLKPEEELRQRLNWFYPWRDYEYEALGLKHFASFSEQLRRDLGDGFTAFRQASYEALVERFGPEEAAELEGISEYQEARFRRAAAAALGANGDESDVELVAPLASHPDRTVRTAALQALVRLSPDAAADAARTLATDKDALPADRQDAATLAVELSTDHLDALVQMDDAKVAATAIAALPDDGDHRDELRRLLHAEHALVREAAVRRLGDVLSREELQTTLDDYLASPSYYYNVVVWLDRFLNCPEPFLQRYRKMKPEVA